MYCYTVDNYGKQRWINTRPRIFKLNIMGIMQMISSADDREITKLLKSLNLFMTGGVLVVLITEILKPNDPSGWLLNLRFAKAKETNGLLKRRALEIVLNEDVLVPKRANILGGCFVPAIKSTGTNDEVCRARYVI